MNTNLYYDADDMLQCLAVHLSQQKEDIPSNGTKEFLGVAFNIMYPEKCIITNPIRKLNTEYIKKEIEWYESGDRDITEISKHASMWKKIADNDNKVNSNYGYHFYHKKTQNGMTQFEWIIDKLRSDHRTRQAIVNINGIEHKYPTKDFPCTTSFQFFIKDKKLHMIVHMRSNDLIFGLCNDLPAFVSFFKKVLDKLNSYKEFDLKMGDYTHMVNSLHVYKRHYEMINKLVKYPIKKYQSKTLDDI
jgi:thymidylate synthase